jgi:hypothetical protein
MKILEIGNVVEDSLRNCGFDANQQVESDMDHGQAGEVGCRGGRDFQARELRPPDPLARSVHLIEITIVLHVNESTQN